MELYNDVSYEIAEKLTKRYSTSFSLSSSLFDQTIRQHIYAIYGMVRIADEIVDSYRQVDANDQLDDLYHQVIKAYEIGYSTNPIIHAYALTARAYGIDDNLVKPFFDSMKTDIDTRKFDDEGFRKYIYGSAEVVGLMCLKVFVGGDRKKYQALEKGAKALGSAYQKVNFLRDIKKDYEELGRVYFPAVNYETFSERQKNNIVADIEKDFVQADKAIKLLPVSAQKAVRASYYYYSGLLDMLRQATVSDIKTARIRIPNNKKLALLLRAKAGL